MYYYCRFRKFYMDNVQKNRTSQTGEMRHQCLPRIQRMSFPDSAHHGAKNKADVLLLS